MKKNKIPLKGTIEIVLAGRRLGDKDVPGKTGKFESAQEAAEFLETEKPRIRGKNKGKQ